MDDPRRVSGRVALSDLTCGPVNAGAVTLFDNRIRDLVRQYFAIVGIARFLTIFSITQKTALDEHGWVNRFANHAKIGHVDAAIDGMRNRKQFLLDSIGHLRRIAGVIIGFEAIDNPAPGIVEMNADKNGILLSILDSDTFIEGNEDITAANHDRLNLGFVKLPLEPFGHIERGNLLRRAIRTVGARISSTMAGIDHDSRKRVAGIFRARGRDTGAAGERHDESKSQKSKA